MHTKKNAPGCRGSGTNDIAPSVISSAELVLGVPVSFRTVLLVPVPLAVLQDRQVTVATYDRFFHDCKFTGQVH